MIFHFLCHAPLIEKRHRFVANYSSPATGAESGGKGGAGEC